MISTYTFFNVLKDKHYYILLKSSYSLILKFIRNIIINFLYWHYFNQCMFWKISKCYVNSTRFIEVIGFIYPSGHCYFHLDVFVKKCYWKKWERWCITLIPFINGAFLYDRSQNSIKRTFSSCIYIKFLFISQTWKFTQ